MLSEAHGLGHALDPPDPADPVSSAAAQDPHTTRAGGQDDGSYTKLHQMDISRNECDIAREPSVMASGSRKDSLTSSSQFVCELVPRYFIWFLGSYSVVFENLEETLVEIPRHPKVLSKSDFRNRFTEFHVLRILICRS